MGNNSTTRELDTSATAVATFAAEFGDSSTCDPNRRFRTVAAGGLGRHVFTNTAGRAVSPQWKEGSVVSVRCLCKRDISCG